MKISNITRIISSPAKLKTLSSHEIKVARNIMRNCFDLKKKESVLIVSDPKKWNEASMFFEAAKLYSKRVLLLVMTERKQDAEEPPREVARLMRESDVQLLVTTKSLSHTKARSDACGNGARIASLPGIDMEMILRTLTVDFSNLKLLSKRLAKILTVGKEARVYSKSGTDISFSLGGRSAIADEGDLSNRGNFGNLPPGEAFIAPVERKTQGVAVIDGCFNEIDLDKPLTLTIESGVVSKIEGGKAALQLRTVLSKLNKKARIVAELGVGTNKNANLSKMGTNSLEIEKVFGTVHIALGNNSTIGGIVDVPFHSDGVIFSPILEVDGKVILKERNFCV